MGNLLPESASSFAPDVDSIISLVTWTVGVWALAAYVLFFLFLLVFRRRAGQRSSYVSGAGKQMAWVLVPVALVLVCDLTIDYFNAPVWNRVKETLPASGDVIRVTGRQWMWEFTYPGADGKFDTADDIKSVNELHVRTNVPTRFELTAIDVLHSFSVPSFRLKQDAVPGRRIEGWFEATKAGTYDIQCTQMCGIGHASMAAHVTVESADDYAKYLKTASAQRNAPTRAVATTFDSLWTRN